MNDRVHTEALVRESYARRRAGDVEGIMASFGADPRFRLAGDDILGAITSEVRGRDALRTAISDLVQAWDWSSHEIDTVLVDNDRVVVHGKGVIRFVPTGDRFVTETLDLLTIADGKIVELVEFCDTHMVAKVMGLSAAR